MSASTPHFWKPGEGRAVNVLGEPRRFLMTPQDTSDTYLLFETSTQPGAGAPAHWHRDEDETFYVLAGSYEVQIGEQIVMATTGACAFVPRGTVHAFTNRGTDAARMLVLVTPGTEHAGLFLELDELTRRNGQPPDRQQTAELASHYGWNLAR